MSRVPQVVHGQVKSLSVRVMMDILSILSMAEYFVEVRTLILITGTLYCTWILPHLAITCGPKNVGLVHYPTTFGNRLGDVQCVDHAHQITPGFSAWCDGSGNWPDEILSRLA